MLTHPRRNFFFFFQAEDGIRDLTVTGVQTCALPICLVRLGTQLRNRIHAVAADHGYDRSASYWTGPGRGWLAELDLPPASREIVTDCLAVIDGLAPLTDRIDGELHARAKADPRVKVLRTLPGVGEFTALVMVAEIGDISQIGRAHV